MKSICLDCSNNHPSQTSGGPPTVHVAASLFQRLCYENKDALSAGIIVAGWDKETGPSVYNIPVGGGIFRQPWAIGGTNLGLCPYEIHH
jgi:20S proteasome subunit beta 1